METYLSRMKVIPMLKSIVSAFSDKFNPDFISLMFFISSEVPFYKYTKQSIEFKSEPKHATLVSATISPFVMFLLESIKRLLQILKILYDSIPKERERRFDSFEDQLRYHHQIQF